MVIVLMGPAGAGKSTVGRALALQLGWRFIEADEFHAAPDIEKMRGGVALTDEERWPWLERVRDAMDAVAKAGDHAVVACSALRQQYRDYLARDRGGVRFVFLNAPVELLRRRLVRRTGHFAAGGLLESQLETLELPTDALTLDASLPVETLVAQIRAALTS
jgi:gluconokinase